VAVVVTLTFPLPFADVATMVVDVVPPALVPLEETLPVVFPLP